MKTHTLDDRIAALAPAAQTSDEQWADATLARILSDNPPRRSLARRRRRVAALAVAGVLTASTGVAAATTGVPSIDAVKQSILDYAAQPNNALNVATSENGIGDLHTPRLAAEFSLSSGTVVSFWTASTSSGEICSAYNTADPAAGNSSAQGPLEYGCGGNVFDAKSPNDVLWIVRADQLGGFLEEDGEPIVYGVSPFPDAVEVRVKGTGVDRTLPVRPDSLGYGSALPEASDADSLTLTFLDSAGAVVGTKTLLAPPR